MSKLVRSFRTFFWVTGMFRYKWLCFVLVLTAGLAHGQEGRKVPISFLPPPLENATYSLGIYEAKSGKLVRRLQEMAPESAFTIGLNGLVTNWGGEDDEGKAVAPGRYAARGYAVGAIKVQGEGGSGNDWAGDDGGLRARRIKAITMLPDDLGFGVLAEVTVGPPHVACYEGTRGKLQWQKPLPAEFSASGAGISLAAKGDLLIARQGNTTVGLQVSDGTQRPGEMPPGEVPRSSSGGPDGTVWKIEEGELFQYSADNERLRHLPTAPGEPLPVMVAASLHHDRIYLMEESPGWQRVRGLAWLETKQEDGKQVSTWQTFFTHNIRPPESTPGQDGPPKPVEVKLADNPLSPGKPARIRLTAGFDEKGSYLTTVDGLRLRQVGIRAGLKAAKLTAGATASRLICSQFDGAAWDEFSIEGAQNMMAFDAGEIEMTAAGEKTHAAKPSDAPDL